MGLLGWFEGLAKPAEPGAVIVTKSAPSIVLPTVLPTVHHRSWPLQANCPSFYGEPSTPGWLHANTVDVLVPWQMRFESTGVNHILIHKNCAVSLTEVLDYIWAACGKDQTKIEALKYDRFSGSYNPRPMRGSTRLSMHAYACAIDWDDAENQFHSTRHLFTDNDLLVKTFKLAGWEWGGDWSAGSVDAMHVQAARTR